MSKQNTGAKKHWWEFPLLCGVLLGILVTVIFRWPMEFLEEFLGLLTLKATIIRVIWSIPVIIALCYAIKIWGGWGGLFSLLVMLFARITAVAALHATFTVFLKGSLQVSLEKFTFAPIVALIIGVALAILFSIRAPKKPLSVALLILVVGLLDGLTLFEGRGSFTDWSIYTAEIIALSWLLVYPVLLELVRKALLSENHK